MRENTKPAKNSEDDDDDKTDEREQQQEQIFQSGSVTAEGGRHKFHCLTVIGQIEGHYTLPPQNKTTKYEHVIPQLVAIEQDDSIKGLLMILNTVGGDVEAGLAIAELVAGMKTPTVSLVLGGGHSIGVPLAVSAQYSFIAPTATMTVHPVRMNGLMLGVPQTLDYFDRMQDRISSFVCENSRIGRERFLELMMNKDELVMDVGTVLDGQDAVAEGLIDSLGSLSDAVEKLYELIDREDKQRSAAKTGRGRKPGSKNAASAKDTDSTKGAGSAKSEKPAMNTKNAKQGKGGRPSKSGKTGKGKAGEKK